MKRLVIVLLILLGPLGIGAQSGAPVFTEKGVAEQKQIGAVLLMQTLPFYDERAIQTLRGFEQRVYRHLVLSSAPPKS